MPPTGNTEENEEEARPCSGGNEFLSQDALDELMATIEPSAEMQFDTSGNPPTQAETVLEPPEPPIATSHGLKFTSFDTGSSAHSANNAPGFDRVQDIPLEITVELGRTHLLIRDILDLGAGSIIELEKTAGEPVDLLANGLLVARGEVVVVEDSFGVRITEIITEAERKDIAAEQWAKAS